MNQTMPENEKVEVLKTNMRYDCRKALVGKSIRPLKDLINIGKELDATDFSAFSKVFGPSKRETCAISTGNSETTGSKTFYSRSQPAQSGKMTNFPPKASKPNANSAKGMFSKPVNQNQKVEPKSDGREMKTSASSKEPQPGSSQPSALLKMVSNYSPPEEGQCFNCGEEHDLSDCTIPRRVFCHACAFKGFTRKNCPFCLKNQIRKS